MLGWSEAWNGVLSIISEHKSLTTARIFNHCHHHSTDTNLERKE
jgi:hypothetical protein